MRSYKWLSVVFVILLSCGKPLPHLEGFDEKVWKDDRSGCNSKRILLKDTLKQQKQKLLALNELQIVDILGRPDQNELYERNQKFYSYFIEPSTRCKNYSSEKPKRLIIRFNAMGLAKEITIE